SRMTTSLTSIISISSTDRGTASNLFTLFPAVFACQKRCTPTVLFPKRMCYILVLVIVRSSASQTASSPSPKVSNCLLGICGICIHLSCDLQGEDLLSVVRPELRYLSCPRIHDIIKKECPFLSLLVEIALPYFSSDGSHPSPDHPHVLLVS